MSIFDRLLFSFAKFYIYRIKHYNTVEIEIEIIVLYLSIYILLQFVEINCYVFVGNKIKVL